MVIAALLPYLLNPEIGLSKSYRGLLIFTSALALPLIDRFAALLEHHFLLLAAVLTWIVNAIALLVLLQVGRLTIHIIRRGRIGS